MIRRRFSHTKRHRSKQGQPIRRSLPVSLYLFSPWHHHLISCTYVVRPERFGGKQPRKAIMRRYSHIQISPKFLVYTNILLKILKSNILFIKIHFHWRRLKKSRLTKIALVNLLNPARDRFTAVRGTSPEEVRPARRVPCGGNRRRTRHRRNPLYCANPSCRNGAGCS